MERRRPYRLRSLARLRRCLALSGGLGLVFAAAMSAPSSNPRPSAPAIAAFITASAQPAGVAGHWEGLATQFAPAGTQQRILVSMQIRGPVGGRYGTNSEQTVQGSGRGQICEGQITERAHSNATVFFDYRERLDTAHCIARTVIALTQDRAGSLGFHEIYQTRIGAGELVGHLSSGRCVTTTPVAVSYTFAEHPSFDRVVFTFRGGLPGWKLSRGYVPRVSQDASGRPVTLDGSVFLQVMFFPARAVDDNCHTTGAEETAAPHLDVLRQIKPAGDFEGYVSFGLGLSRRRGYRLFALHHPDRVVLDLTR
jgi:hypothetical protein